MHGAGIYRQRYGRDPGLSLSHADEVKDEVDAFVAEQEAGWATRLETLEGADETRWDDYELLQLYDRLSLYFCMQDVEAGGPAEIQGFRLEPLGPWRVRLSPYPFADGSARFALLRRLVPKRSWSNGEFGRAFLELAPERVELVIDPG
jgi:hypothetical protein